MNFLAVTPGDPDGIGPEILIKILLKKSIPKNHSLIIVGALKPFQKVVSRFRFQILEAQESLSLTRAQLQRRIKKNHHFFIPAPIPPTVAPLRSMKKSFCLEGYQSGWAVVIATELVKQKKARAIVTGPISKQRLQAGGFSYPGHTELLAHLCGKKTVTMMLANPKIAVSMVTTHIPLSKVSQSLTQKKITQTIDHTIEFVLKKRRPHSDKPHSIAVLGLNPHAGEGGIIGTEEKRIIIPAIKSAAKKYPKICFTGPHSADTFFATHQKKWPDAVIAMYHDQGLIPIKLIDFNRTINITLGLPICRTSVDHGTAFEIVGKNIANPSSLQWALDWAALFG